MSCIYVKYQYLCAYYDIFYLLERSIHDKMAVIELELDNFYLFDDIQLASLNSLNFGCQLFLSMHCRPADSIPTHIYIL